MNKIHTKKTPSQAIIQYSTVTNACKQTIQHHLLAQTQMQYLVVHHGIKTNQTTALYVHSFLILKHHNLIIVCIKLKEVKFSGAFVVL
jgi:hypothetical protein